MQIKKRNRLSIQQIEYLVYIQANLKVLEGIAMEALIVEIKPNIIDIRRVPPEMEDLYALLREKTSNQPKIDSHKNKKMSSRDS